MAVPSQDIQAEEALAGGAIAFRPDLPVMLEALEPEDFYSPKVSVLWSILGELHRSGSAVDHVTIRDAYARRKLECDEQWINHLLVISVRPMAEHADVIIRRANSRRVASITSSAKAEIDNGADPYEIADRVMTDLGALDAPVLSARQQARTLDDVIATADKVAPWIIPGMMRRDWRCLVVAREGGGKSVLLRQIGACAAQGIHPLKFSTMEPIRVLLVDLENPAAAIAETGAKIVGQLRRMLGEKYNPEQIRVLQRQGGIDLRTRHDRTELERECTAQRPDLVIIGPVYKMLVRRDRGRETESHEEATDPVLRILDDLRTRHGFALLMEHHAPQGHGGGRDLRPYGSQRWLAWPEIGIGMTPASQTSTTYKLSRWRGDRLKCDWPTEISHGQVWPFEGTWDKRPDEVSF